MCYFIVLLSVVLAGLFIWASIDYRKQKKLNNKEKPPFRTEEDLEEYGKPLKDEESKVVDFDDAE